ncbi:MAG: hypothetical protein ABH808_03375, partial [Candidatus Kuenenbacteria bacterium]
MEKNIFKKLFFFFLFSFFISYFLLIAFFTSPVLAWDEPTEEPTGGNISKPINESDETQIKAGALTVSTTGSENGNDKGLTIGGSALILGANQNLIYGNINSANPTSSLLLLQNSGIEKFKIDRDGKITIADTGKLCFQSDCKASWGEVGGGSWTKSGNDIYNSNTGNVGIGTISPEEKLDVIGNIKNIANANATPSRIGAVTLNSGENNGFSIAVSGRYAYISTQTSPAKVIVVDISNPSAPSRIGAVTLSSGENSGQSIAVSGRYAYISTYTFPAKVIVVDISNPSAPSRIGAVTLSSGENNGFSIAVSGRYAYILTPTIPAKVIVVDISNPSAPSRIGAVTLNSGENYGRSIAVSGRYAYILTSTIPAKVIAVDIIGIETTSLIAHSLEAGQLQVKNDITAQGQLRVAGGLNVGKGIYSSGETGIYSNSSASTLTISQAGTGNIMDLLDNGTSVFTVLDGGNVGIGTTTPGYKLDVSDTGDTAIIRLENKNTNKKYTGLRLDRNNLAEKWFIGMKDTANDDKLYFQRGGSSNDLTIDTNGNVGIGTTNLGQKLSIAGTLGILEGGTSPSLYTIFQGGDQTTANITYTLPTTYPTANEQSLISTTAGVMSWKTTMTNPMNAIGDIIYSSTTSGTPTKLVGSAGFLKST